MFPKDREAKTKQSNIIYWFKCGRTKCDDEYFGESYIYILYIYIYIYIYIYMCVCINTI